MSERIAAAMDATDIGEFLDAQQTGVLSLSKGGDAYAIPVSFTYKPERSRIFFRLGYAPGSQKKKFLEATDHAAFVVYADTPDGWQSVVASGRIEELSRTNVDSSVVEALEHLEIPFFSVFERPTEDIEFTIAALHVDKLDGRTEAT